MLTPRDEGQAAYERRHENPIPDDAVVLRRICPIWFGDEDKPSSAAFDDSPDGSDMSVDLQSLVVGDPVGEYPGYGLVSLKVSALRALDLEVYSWPTEGNPAHCGVRGKKTKSLKRALKNLSEWVTRPHP